jgi:hypothetical protein
MGDGTPEWLGECDWCSQPVYAVEGDEGPTWTFDEEEQEDILWHWRCLDAY